MVTIGGCVLVMLLNAGAGGAFLPVAHGQATGQDARGDLRTQPQTAVEDAARRAHPPLLDLQSTTVGLTLESRTFHDLPMGRTAP